MTHKEFEEMLISRQTLPVYEKLKNARIGIAGLGGLGSNIAMMLARAGVGSLVLADFDTVEISNLNRQHYFIRHLGMKKSMALEEQLKEVNPWISLKTYDIRITGKNAAEIFKDCPIICEAFDNPVSKAELTSAVLSDLPNTYVVAGSGMAGHSSANNIRTTHPMRRLYVCGDGVTEIGNDVSLIAPRVQLCAAHQANAAIRLCLGLTDI